MFADTVPRRIQFPHGAGRGLETTPKRAVSERFMTNTDSLAQRVEDALAHNPGAMTMQLAWDFGVAEVDIIRALPDGRAVELDLSRFEALMGRLEAVGKVHVIVSNGGATLEVIGEFGHFSTLGEFFNVQTNSLDMHIRYRNLAAAFAVEKPSHMTGVNTLSVQFYDHQGMSAFKVFLSFGAKPPAPEQVAWFNRVREEFKKQCSGAGNLSGH
jgi:putative hemin transport protein